jgi:hypothetical protein
MTLLTGGCDIEGLSERYSGAARDCTSMTPDEESSSVLARGLVL